MYILCMCSTNYVLYVCYGYSLQYYGYTNMCTYAFVIYARPTQKELMSSVTEISSLKAHIKELEDKLMQQV